MNKKFTILITSKNRKEDLAFTLGKIKYLIESGVKCIICDDGSTDGTSDFLKVEYPTIQLIRNPKSKGLIYSRNRLLHLVTSEFAISLDDDAHFITKNPLESILNYFNQNEACGLISMRIFWGLENPIKIASQDEITRVKGFVGCGHAWRMKAWHDIPNYPDWFIFYGEEDFAAYQLFKKNWEIHYLPEVLVKHCVDIKARKYNNDYRLRLRRSLRSGWYLFVLFYPLNEIPRRFSYTLWVQIKNKVFKGDWMASLAIIQALCDLMINLPKLLKNSNRLSLQEFRDFNKLPDTKLYWTPENL